MKTIKWLILLYSIMVCGFNSIAIANDKCISNAQKFFANDTTDGVRGWSLDELNALNRHQSLSRKKFLRYIHQKYPVALRKRIRLLAGRINGTQGDKIYFNYFYELEKGKILYRNFKKSNPLPEKVGKLPIENWGSKTWAYLYVSKAGVKIGNKTATFDDLALHLDYYKQKLGVDVLYLLPINKSPRMDDGYDVSDFKEIAHSLGGTKAFDRFMKQVRARNMKVVMDFVPGHISEKHEWFQRALKGDKKYLNYFLNAKKIPPNKLVREDNGDVYVEYMDEEVGGYRRLLLFPDYSTKHWNKHQITAVDGKMSDHYFYSTFYPFQKDLDLRNSDVLGEHFSTLGYWISRGINGIRADAIPWWVKVPGHHGEHAKENYAVSELFHSFLKHIDPYTLFMPEVVSTQKVALDYIGKQVIHNGRKTGKKADSVFNFSKSVHVLYAGVSGNFKEYSQFLDSNRQLVMPENTFSILHNGNHHDEIYLGFLGKEAKKDLQNRIRKAGGIVYKGGNSGGAMYSDLLGHDPVKMYAFQKFLFGHQGTIAIYQGTELGVGNSWKVAISKTIDNIEKLRELGAISDNDPVFLEIADLRANPDKIKGPLPDNSEIKKYVDGRLLHRSDVTQEMFDDAINGRNEFFNRFKKLPHIRKASQAVSVGDREEPLNTMRSDIGSFMRRERDANGNVIEEVAVIKNGTGEETEVNLSWKDLTAQKHFSLYELDYEKDFDFIVNGGPDDGFITIKLKPYETLWLKIVP